MNWKDERMALSYKISEKIYEDNLAINSFDLLDEGTNKVFLGLFIYIEKLEARIAQLEERYEEKSFADPYTQTHLDYDSEGK